MRQLHTLFGLVKVEFANAKVIVEFNMAGIRIMANTRLGAPMYFGVLSTIAKSSWILSQSVAV